MVVLINELIDELGRELVTEYSRRKKVISSTALYRLKNKIRLRLRMHSKVYYITGIGLLRGEFYAGYASEHDLQG